MPHPDQKYIVALVNGNTTLLREIYQEFSPKIFALVESNNGTAEDAADLFQEALLMIYRKATTTGFVLTCPMEAFLYLVCKNRWMNEVKKRYATTRQFSDSEKFDIGEETFVLEETCRMQHQRRQLIEQKLSEMSEGCRQLLRLCWSGKPLEQVAATMKFSYAYVRKRKTLCLQKLGSMVKSASLFTELKW